MTELADEYWSYRTSHHHWDNLILGELGHLEAWMDESLEGDAAFRAAMHDFVTRAEAEPGVSASDQILNETVAASAFVDAVGRTWWGELGAPNRQTGLLAELLPSLRLQPLVTAEHGDRYLEKLSRFGAMIDQLVERLRHGAAKGIVPLTTHARQTIEFIDDLLDRDNDAFSGQAAPVELDGNAAGSWPARVAEAIRSNVHPGPRSYREALAAVTVPAGRPDDEPGICHLEGGDEIYADAVRGHTTLDISAEQVHEIGLREIARLDDEYRRLAGPILGTTDLAEIYTRLREAPELHYDNADEIIADALRCLDKASAAMGEWFDPVPQAPCTASATDSGAMAYYRPPSHDGSMPGQFFFNIADPAAWAKFQIPAIAYHESIPGHHLQFALGIENDRVHDLHRIMYLSAYGEGWGLYTEQLADEMGLYENDLERIGMLMADSMRAGRLVVDTGMHAMGWTRQQAIDYLADNSPMAIHEVTEEIDRYIANPGQALSYMMGRLEIQDIRTDAEERLGDAFDIKAFHNVVLGNGTVPMSTLRRMTDAWVASERA